MNIEFHLTSIYYVQCVIAAVVIVVTVIVILIGHYTYIYISIWDMIYGMRYQRIRTQHKIKYLRTQTDTNHLQRRYACDEAIK